MLVFFNVRAVVCDRGPDNCTNKLWRTFYSTRTVPGRPAGARVVADGGGGADDGGAGDKAASRRRERGRALARVLPRAFHRTPAAGPAPPPPATRPAACEAHPPVAALPRGHTPTPPRARGLAEPASPSAPPQCGRPPPARRPRPWPPPGHAGRTRGGGLAAVEAPAREGRF